MAGSCGACTLCCTLMRVEMAPVPKPAGERCTFCVDGGCAIYQARPDPCLGFECVWLCSQRWPDRAMPAHERPDRTGIVIEVNSKGCAIAHCETPEAWARPAARKRLLIFAKSTQVTIEHGDGRVSLLEVDGLHPEGVLRPLKYLSTAPNNERLYVRDKERLTW